MHDESGNIRLSRPAGRWVLLATVLGSSMAFLDSTVVNVALPTLGRDLKASLSGLQWTVNGYTLTLAGLILLGGALGDRFGRRRIFLIGVCWFAASSLLCGLAPNIGVLVAARVLQGIGGALLTPGALALIQASFRRQDRPRAVGAWSGLGGIAGAFGPFLGGWLVQGPGWRWVFLLNLPLAAVVIAVAARHVPESRDPQATGRFDVGGAVLAAAALAGITYALIQAPDSGASWAVVGSAVLGVVLCVAFVWRERVARHPMLPLSIFESRQFTGVNIVTLIIYAALSGIMFFLVVQLQVSAGFSAVTAGLALLPITLLLLVLSARAGALAQRIGPRLLMTIGPLASAVGVLLLSRVGPGASYFVDVLGPVTIFGLGLAATVAPLTATVLASASERRAGTASGVNNAVARAGGLLAVAALPLLVGLSGNEYTSARAFTSGFRDAMFVCAGLLVVGALLSWLTTSRDALASTVQPEVSAEQGPAAS